MLEVGKRYESERTGGWIQIVERTDTGMSFERRYAPNTGRADPHLHQDFTQTWQAVVGEGTLEVDGEERPLPAGESVSIEPGTPHRDPWSGDEAFTVRGHFSPCPAFIEAYAEAWAHHMREGTVNAQDEMPLLQILLLAKEHDGRSYRAGIPVALQKASLPLAVAIARRRGMRGSYEL